MKLLDQEWFEQWNQTDSYLASDGTINRIPLRLTSSNVIIYGSANLIEVLREFEHEVRNVIMIYQTIDIIWHKRYYVRTLHFLRQCIRYLCVTYSILRRTRIQRFEHLILYFFLEWVILAACTKRKWEKSESWMNEWEIHIMMWYARTLRTFASR